LEALPLALELAAARMRALSPAQLLERLSQRLDLLKAGRGADARQQTLRATIEWSYDLLTPEEQRLFARLAVFRGGCTLEAGEEVAAADLDALQSLVDKSLVRYSNRRYWMLETIREYASERLEDSGEGEELRRQHAEWFLAYVEETEPRALLGSPDEKELLDRLAREYDNLRAVLDHLEAAGDGERVLRLTGAMWPLWALRGPIAEGQRWLEHALASGGGTAVARAHALTGLMSLGELAGEARQARAEEELTLYRELGDAWGATHAVFMLGFAAAELESDEIAQQHWEEALDGFQEVGDEHFATVTRDCLAWVYAELGDRRRATALNEDNLRRAREASNRRVEAFALDRMAMLALDEGRVEEAVSLLNESVVLYRALEVPAEAAECLCYIAATAAAARPPEHAVSILSTALSRFDELGVTVPFWVERRNKRTLAVVRGQLEDSAFDAAWERGKQLTLDEAVALALGEVDQPDA
jgi:non-specific serine/threonine protein kinase